ncbi:MAG: diacylglycerol O-acyltransferase / wax synthase, partial [Solirubrobacteraceae bacterium]|nr:diacylglycerol O-acyltransferase / wax synthase [Solirubrobacteraceae bacterium]
MDALSPQDATFLNVEDDVSHMHIGTIGIFEGPPPTRDELGSAIASKLHLVPRYRQRVRYPPLRLGQPGWVDDSHFNLDYHVRRTGLAHPGDEAELRRLVGRVMSQQLDRAKPLWEMWAAEGLDDGRWALVSKVHHCMVDGVASIDLLSLLFDAEADPIREPAPPWTPTPEPSGPDLLKQIASRGVTGPLGAARGALGLMGRSGDTIAHVAGTARGAAAMRGMLRPTPRTSLNGPLGPHRRWDWA